MYISTTEELNEFVERARRFRVIAVDTEFLREKTYHPMLCLIQVATAEEAVAIDPLKVEDMSSLAGLLKDTSCTKVFHACDQDLEVIHDSLGVYVEPVFDTQLAAAFLGHRMQLGYGALVLEYEDVRLPKADGLTDWSKRPLDQSQLEYALDDVYYLPSIYEQMMEDLIRRDRLAWFEPEMAALADPARIERDPAKAYLHLKRSSSLARKQLAHLRKFFLPVLDQAQSAVHIFQQHFPLAGERHTAPVEKHGLAAHAVGSPKASRADETGQAAGEKSRAAGNAGKS